MEPLIYLLPEILVHSAFFIDQKKKDKIHSRTTKITELAL